MKKDNSSSFIINFLILIITICLGIFVYKTIDKNRVKEIETNNNLYQNSIIENENNNENNSISYKNEADKYYYKQLNENAKMIYNGMYNNKQNLKKGNYTIEFGNKFNTLLNSNNGNQILRDDFQSAWNAFSYDNMDVFYIDISKFKLLSEGRTRLGKTEYKVSIGILKERYSMNESDINDDNYFKDDFKTREEIEEAIKYLELTRNNIVKEANKYITDYEKVKYVHDYLVSNIEYEEKDINKSSNYTIYGALKEKRAVCEGYSRTLKYILDELNIPCLLIPGSGINEKNEMENHAWNYVLIDNKWYAVDLTWDDPIIIGNGYVNNDIHYKYFLKGSNDFFINHKESNKLVENSQEFSYPILSKFNYF